jgi:chromosome segregation ATPase
MASSSTSPPRTTELAVRHEEPVGLTLESAKDTMAATLLIRELQQHNADLRARISAEESAADTAEGKVSAAKKRLAQHCLDEAALVHALQFLNERISIAHDGLHREQDKLRAAEVQHTNLAQKTDTLAAQVDLARRSTQHARRDLEVAAMERGRVAEARKEAAAERKAKLADARQLRARERHAQAQQLRGQLKSAALQRDIKQATDAVARARQDSNRPPFRNAVAVQSP